MKQTEKAKDHQLRGSGGPRPEKFIASSHPCGQVEPFATTLNWQRALGNQEVIRMLRAAGGQAKLHVSQSEDPYEQEADRVAEQVMRTPAEACAPPPLPYLYRQASPGAQKQVDGPRPAPASTTPAGTHAVPDNFLSQLGSGQPLDPATRSFFEPRFGRDFSGVRIHTDSRGAESARAVNARAFTAADHVVFGRGEYGPHSAAGRHLLAHELTHVTQQGRTSQRPVIHRLPPQQEIPKDAIPGTFTVVKTKRLNGQGAFTGQVLREISGNWTQKSAYGGPDVAQRVVDALESSDSFVEVANALDDFHIKKGNPTFRIFGGFTGTKFVPAGSTFQTRADESVQVVPDENTIIIDYTSSVNLFGPKPEQLVAFASAIIHESRHAYDHIKKITKGGLQGHLEEEQRTRKAEIKGLEEIKSASQGKDVKAEVDKRTAQIKQGGLTNREIAEDFVSGGGGTYLESFEIGSAIDDFNSRRATLADKLKPSKSLAPDLLDKIGTVSESDLDSYETSVKIAILMLSPTLAEGMIPPSHMVHRGARAFLFEILIKTMTLKQLTDLKPPHLSNDERLLLLYLLLVKIYRIKLKVAQAWKAYREDPDPKKKSETIEKNARELLGMPRAYAGIRP